MKAARSAEADQGHIVILSLLPVVQLAQIKALQQRQVMFLSQSISAEGAVLEGMAVFQSVRCL